MNSDISLDTFVTAINTLLAVPMFADYRFSGGALVNNEDNSVYFSASLYLPEGPTSPPAPSVLKPLFISNRINGFKFKAIQTIVFKSTATLPDPKWRVQVLYTAE